MTLPNFIQYYWACDIDKLCYWIYSKANMGPNGATVIKASLQSLKTAELPLKAHNISQNPVVINWIKIWIQFHEHFRLVFKNNLFPPSSFNHAFCIWRDKGLINIKDLQAPHHHHRSQWTGSFCILHPSQSPHGLSEYSLCVSLWCHHCSRLRKTVSPSPLKQQEGRSCQHS